jgi:hypothetical protein
MDVSEQGLVTVQTVKASFDTLAKGPPSVAVYEGILCLETVQGA